MWLYIFILSHMYYLQSNAALSLYLLFFCFNFPFPQENFCNKQIFTNRDSISCKNNPSITLSISIYYFLNLNDFDTHAHISKYIFCVYVCVFAFIILLMSTIPTHTHLRIHISFPAFNLSNNIHKLQI